MKDTMSSILTFLKKILHIFEWELELRIWWENILLRGFWHSIYTTLVLAWAQRECKSFVRPMHNRNIMACSLLDFYKAGFHSPRVGFIMKALLCMFFFQRYSHILWKNWLVWGFKSVHGILTLSDADLAAVSAFFVSLCFNVIWDPAS